MSSLSKLSFFLLVLGFLAAPFFIFAANIDTARPAGSLQTFSRAFDGFSLKNLDARIYARIQEGGLPQAAEANEWWASFVCSDGADNDGDGRTDFFFSGGVDSWATYDPGCDSWFDDSEQSGVQCDDGIDNDGDGVTDFPADYPDCWWLDDTSEGSTPQCSDGIDNDGDGQSDYPDDPGCSSPSDTSEYGNRQCDDDVDNDGVNGKDFKIGGLWGTGDPNCESSSDNSEGCTGPRCHVGLPPEPQGAINPSVDLYLDNNPSINSHTLVGNAYNTNDSIYWNVQDSCDCTGTPGNWFTAVLDGSGDNVSSGVVENIVTPGSIVYALTCNKKPSCNPSVGTNSDSVTITPLWSPQFSFSGPASVITGEHVNLIWSGNDIKSCSASGWSGPGTSALQVSNTLQNQDHSVDVGTLSADKTFYLTCTGYNDAVLSQKTWTVDLITSPTPYFFINSINLIIIGPGSGGRSNKATIGVTPGGGFTGTINLSAANGALTSAGAVLHVEPSTITCDGVSCTTAEFWVETAGDLAEAVYTITLTADPVPSGFDSKTQDISLRVRRFVPAFEEI